MPQLYSLSTHPAVVGQLWIGVVDNKGATAEKLAAILRRRGLSYDIQLFDVATIPRGANGKVNRQQLEALIRATRDRR
jgi:hypothetical protein